MTPWTVACQAPLSTGFLRQEYWSGLPFPSTGDLPDPGIKPMSPAFAEFFTAEPPRKPHKPPYGARKAFSLVGPVGGRRDGSQVHLVISSFRLLIPDRLNGLLLHMII